MAAERRAGVGLKATSAAVMLFLYFPLLIVLLYAFTTQSSSFRFPPPGLTLDWFGVAWGRADMWRAMRLSITVAAVATGLALVLGSLLAAAVSRTRFFGRETVSLLVILPIVLPGIVTGMALRSTFILAGIPFSTFTIVLGHATFCIVLVYNNVLARYRRLGPSLREASADLGATGFQTLRHVILPHLVTALLAGGMLAFALSFDEIIVTTFTSGQQRTLPIWIFSNLNRPRSQPVLNVVAILVMAITFVPVLLAQRLSGGGARGKVTAV